MRSSRYEARGKFGEHERCVRVARGVAESNSSFLIRSVIGPQNFYHSLDQWNAKLTPILDTRVFPRFPAFSRALGELPFFVLSCYWLFRVFSFLLIGHCNFFWFWFTTQALYDSPASFGNYQLLMTLNWQNFYRTRRMFENLKLDDYTRTHIQVTVLKVLLWYRYHMLLSVKFCLQSIYPFNSHEWPRQNFSSQYPYNIKQTSDKNKEKYQLGDY